MKLGQRISVISKYVRRRINHKIFEIGTKKEIPFDSTELILVLIFILVITSNLDIIANINDLNFSITQYKSSNMSHFSELFKMCAKSNGYVNIFSSYSDIGFDFKINTTYSEVKIFMQQMEEIFVINNI